MKHKATLYSKDWLHPKALISFYCSISIPEELYSAGETGSVLDILIDKPVYDAVKLLSIEHNCRYIKVLGNVANYTGFIYGTWQTTQPDKCYLRLSTVSVHSKTTRCRNKPQQLNN